MTMAGRRLQEFIGDVMLSHAILPEHNNEFCSESRSLARSPGGSCANE
jgi:hypothetical protein